MGRRTIFFLGFLLSLFTLLERSSTGKNLSRESVNRGLKLGNCKKEGNERRRTKMEKAREISRSGREISSQLLISVRGGKLN